MVSAAFFFAALSSITAVEPDIAWRFDAQSNLYAAPVVADVHPSPGQEILISDSEAKRLRCISATGQQLWEYAGKWKQRLVSAAAVADTPGATHLIAIANEDATVHCLSGQTGEMVWTTAAGAVEWGGVLWTDLTGDGQQELVVGTEKAGVVALDAQGQEIWYFKGDVEGEEFDVQCPLAAVDITGEGKAEIFGCEKRGPFALGAGGGLLWRYRGSDDFLSTTLLSRVDDSGAASLFCLSREDAFLWRFDAQHGTVQWRAPLLAGPDVYAGSSLAAGDLNGDGHKELVCADGAGHVYACSASGEVLWTFSANSPIHIAPVLANVNADDYVEVLAASGDHRLYCLSFDGRLLWQFETGLRITAPPTVADLENDGLADVLLCGSDRTLYCLKTHGRYIDALMPWPQRGRNAAQTGNDLQPEQPEASLDAYQLAKHALDVKGSFEEPKVTENALAHPKSPDVERMRARQPRGWRALDPTSHYQWDSAEKTGRERSLRLEDETVVLSERLALGPGCMKVVASAQCLGAGAMRLRWYDADGLVSETPAETASDLSAAVDVSQAHAPGWRKVLLEAAPPSFGTLSVEAVLTSSTGTTYWDDVQLTSMVRERKQASVLVNQVGYDRRAPKSFVVQANFTAQRAAFEVISQQDQTVALEGEFHPGERIVGRYGSDWGHEYLRGDFSNLARPGEYRIRANLDGLVFTSYPFQIQDDLLWEATARPAYRFFYYQRCGMGVPGFHEACHLDDSTGPDGQGQFELWGGWHDAGDYNKYHNAPYLNGLARAYAAAREAFQAQLANAEGTDAFLDELLWGGAHVQRMLAPDGSAYGPITSGYGFWGPPELETDNVPGTGDERPIRGMLTGNNPSEHHEALARLATLAADPAAWIAAADRGLQWSLAHGKRGLAHFSTAVDLYAVTRDEKYAALASGLLPAPSASPEVVDAIQRYDALFGEDHQDALRQALVAEAEQILLKAANPFGVYTYGTAEAPNFFDPPADGGGWHVGTSSYLLQAATVVALACQYQPDPRFLQFIYDQFNWTLGMNPFNVSLMEGAGTAFLPSYHHRYTFSGVKRGAVPGGVVNGITWRAVGDDRPFLDMTGLDIPEYSSNEVWLPHNTNYINALVQLFRATRPQPGEPPHPK